MDSIQKLVCCGVSHKTLSLSDRERIQPSRERWDSVLRALLRTEGLRCGVLVATCNRIEFYLETESSVHPTEGVLDALGAEGTCRERARESSYLLRGDEAVRHLFRVASGLDSMCIGESEVLGQVKEAYSLACRCCDLSNMLHRLFHGAFRVGKQVRNETNLGCGVRSLAGAAQSLLMEATGGLEGKKLLIIGVNKMTETIAFRTHGLEQQVFSNRTHCRAKALARRLGGETRRFEDLERTLAEVDAVFTCTGAPGPILSAERLESVLTARGENAPLAICDLAVPRDVEATPGRDAGLVLVDQTAVQAHFCAEERGRTGQVEEAEGIVEEQAAAFRLKLRHSELSDSGQAFLSGVRRALERELSRFGKGKSPEEVATLEHFGQRLADKATALGLVHMRAEREHEGGSRCPHRAQPPRATPR